VRAGLVLLVVAVLAGCSGSGAETTTTKPSDDTVPIGTLAKRPNIVFVLTDDLSGNLVPYMPNVRAMMRRGATFTNYYVTDSLCCPSRASIFTGLYPHSTGVVTNSNPDGGLWNFNRLGNPDRTFAVALQEQGYKTALMGKYLNGYEPELPPAKGWNDWAVAGNGGYGAYTYKLNVNGRIHRHGDRRRDYLTEVLSRYAKTYVTRAASADATHQPFLLEIATFAPHSPFVAAPRDQGRFAHLRAPRSPAFDYGDRAGRPRWLDHQPLTRGAVALMDRWFRKRVRAVQAIDRMVGGLQRRIRARGLASDTYFVFSSDNGFHMGEHRLRPGKMTAFDTDIRVPLVIAGPGIRPGMRIDALAENIDLAPTFEELAGQTPSPEVEGRSLVPLLRGHTPPDWRRAVLVEHLGPDRDPSDPDFPRPKSGNPPSYKAMRSRNALYVEYTDGAREYYDTTLDPFQLRNAYTALSPEYRRTLHRQLKALSQCSGGAGCHRADQLLPASSNPRSTPTTFRPSTPRS
jgi:arylsulfatase A-like enzyme